MNIAGERVTKILYKNRLSVIVQRLQNLKSLWHTTVTLEFSAHLSLILPMPRKT